MELSKRAKSEMEWLIKDIEQNGKLTSGSEAAKRPVPNFEGKVDKGRDDESNKATLYRMVTDEHICPYGLRSKDLLERKGYDAEDHHLTSRDETDKFKAEHGVETTPQTFINGNRIAATTTSGSFSIKVKQGKPALPTRRLLQYFQ